MAMHRGLDQGTRYMVMAMHRGLDQGTRYIVTAMHRELDRGTRNCPIHRYLGTAFMGHVEAQTHFFFRHGKTHKASSFENESPAWQQLRKTLLKPCVTARKEKKISKAWVCPSRKVGPELPRVL